VRLPRRRRRDLDKRVEHARREAEESLLRLAHAREHVVAPLIGRAARNEFADLIRTSLQGGPVEPRA
jgi:hypothetical protein